MTPLRPINPGEATGNGRELVRAVEAKRRFAPNGVIRARIYTRLALLLCSAMFLFAPTAGLEASEREQAPAGGVTASAEATPARYATLHKTVKIGGLEIF